MQKYTETNKPITDAPAEYIPVRCVSAETIFDIFQSPKAAKYFESWTEGDCLKIKNSYLLVVKRDNRDKTLIKQLRNALQTLYARCRHDAKLAFDIANFEQMHIVNTVVTWTTIREEIQRIFAPSDNDILACVPPSNNIPGYLQPKK